MGDLRDFYSALTAGRRRAKDMLFLRSLEQRKMLIANGFEIAEFNSGLDWRIKKDEFVFNYWPTTTLWTIKVRDKTVSGRGINKLLEYTERHGKR